MKKVRFWSLLVTFIFGTLLSVTAQKVHTIGDSTQEQRATDGSTDKRGWTQMLQQFIDDSQFTVNNRGKSGASSKSFYKENGFWNTLVTGGSDQMQSGDILIIQFAHNDEKTGGSDGDEVKAYYESIGDATKAASTDYRGTTADGTYKEYLRKYVDEAKAMGVKPILVGAICRKYFKDENNTKINAAGQHNLWQKYNYIDKTNNTYVENYTGQKTDDHTKDYTYQMSLVAAEYDDVPFVNLTQGTKELYEALGEEYCTKEVFCKDDGTHPALVGATLIARKFAQMVKDQAETEPNAAKKAVLAQLAAAVQINNEMTFTPSDLDMGDAYIGTYAKNEVNLSAFGLTPSTGTVTVTVDNDFEVSADGTTYASTANFDYAGGTLITTIYVRKKIGTVGEATCTLTASDGTNSKEMTIKVNGLSVSTGTETSLVWPLTSGVAATENEMFTASDETLTGMEIKNYAVIGESGVTMQRLMPAGTAWPGGEIDEVSTRYVEFKATIPEGKTFYMDNISFNVAGVSAGDLGIHAYYATTSSFTDATLIAEKTKMTGNAVNEVSKDVMKTLEAGETIYIRVYPWKEAAAASGKYVALSAMTIHGIMANKTSDAATFGIGREFKSENVFEDGLEKEMGTAPTGVTFSQCSTTFPGTTTGQTLKHGAATPTYTGGTVIRNLYNGAAVKNAFVDGFYWGFKVTIPDGYFMSVSQMYSDVYGVKNTLTSKFVVRSSLDGVNIYESDTHAANVEGGGELCKNTLDVTNVAALQELTGDVYFLMPWYSGSTATYYALKDFNITATLTQDVPTVKYELTTAVSPAEAGKVYANPENSSYKEGTKVTLTTKRNFGYKFKEWQLDGKTVSTEASYEVTMDAAKNITAVFETVPVYTITTKVVNDADRSLGSITLTPNNHENKYEAGEEVTATANTSKILTFKNWEDNTTVNPRAITVSGDMTITANYEVQDFIAVFDASATEAYDRTGNGFAADLTWDADRNAHASVVKVSDGNALYSHESGTPVVRNRTKVVVDGLNGLYQNGFYTTDIAWQYSFSTKGFTSAKFSGQMAAKNSATKNYKAQYSIDGETFTDIEGATLAITTGSQITDYEFDLPAAAIGQATVSVRITGTGTDIFNKTDELGEWLGLKYCKGSESGVGNVFVLGKAEVEEDSEAPVVSSMLPADNATGVSASGRITISYNERIEAGATDLKVSLTAADGTSVSITPAWSNRSVSFDYFALAYGETYTFSMPAGFVQDRSGNKAAAVTLSFTVMERVQPAARTFDAIVDQSLDVDKVEATATMPAQYKKIQDAINDAPSASTRPYLIFIKEGYYNDPNETFNSGYGLRYTNPSDASSKETEQITGGKSEYDECRLVYVNKPNIHLIGQAIDKVTIAGNRLDGGDNSDRTRPWYHVNAGATLEVQAGATDFYMENITVDNENWTKLKKEGPQALAMNISADRAVFNNVNVRSYQDTYYAGGTITNRQFWHKSTIEGGVDFIYGNGCDVFFESCMLNINRKTGGYIVAPSHPDGTRWGYVFNNTTISSTYFTPEDGKVYLGRPWHEHPKTVFLHTQMELGAYEGYWHETMGGIPALWAVYDIWDKNGNKMSEYSIEDYWYKDSSTGETITGKAKNSLTDEEAAAYTLSNVLAGDGTSNAETGVWNPLPVVEQTDAPQLAVGSGCVTWNAVPYAICYVVTVNGKVVAFPTETAISGLSEGDVVSVQAVNEYGALSVMSDEATVLGTTSVVMAASGYTTLVSTEALDFQASGLEAYIATEVNDVAETVTLTAITSAPANTPVVLKGTPGKSYDITVTASPAALPAINLLAGSATETTILTEGTAYLLSGGKFFLNNAGVMPAGKAYLPKRSDARELTVIFGETTGIGASLNEKGEIINEEWYTLEGRRLQGKPMQKGVYIHNKLKVVIK